MKLFWKVGLSILVYFAFIAGSNGQGILYNYGNTLISGDSVNITLSEYRDSVFWEKSYDLINWEAIEGGSDGKLEFIGDNSASYRAIVLEGSCDPVISDSTSINVLELKENSILIDRYGPPTISSSTNLADGVYKFDFEFPDPVPESTSFLISSVDRGYFRKIIATDISQGQTTFLTSPANLTDIYRKGVIRDSIKLYLENDPDIHSGEIAIPLVQNTILKSGILTKALNGINLGDLTLYDEDINGGRLLVKMVNGDIQFDPTVRRAMNILPQNPPLKEYHISFDGELRFSCDMEVSSTIPVESVSHELLIGSYLYGPISFGPIPMFIKLTFTLGFHINMNMPGVVQSGFDENSKVQLGAKYEATDIPNWSHISEISHTYNDHQVIWEKKGNVSNTFYLKISFDTEIAGMEGSHMELQSFNSLDANVDEEENTWEWMLTSGMNQILTIEPDFLDSNIEGTTTTINEFGTTLAAENGALPVPVLSTVAVTDITATSAFSGGTIIDDNGFSIYEKGICWSTSEDPRITDSNQRNDEDELTYLCELTGLSPQTTYYVRAYAINSEGVGYGNMLEFITGSGGPPPPPPPPPPPTPPPSTFILVTSPQSGTNWQAGSNYDILWNDDISENVKIDLFNGASILSTLATSTASDGTYSLTIPADLSPGNEYRIRVSSISDVSINDYSDYFTITAQNQSCEDIYENTEYWDPNTSAFPDALASSAYNNSISGTIHEAGDWDHYQINVQSAGTINLTLSNIPDGYDLQLYDFNDDLVGSSYTVGDEQINETISSPGNYLIIVGSSQDDYSCSTYTLNLNWTPDSEPPPPPPSGCEDIYENTEYWDPNTSAFPDVLTLLPNSSNISGTIHEAGDWDHYQINVQSTGTINLSLSNIPDGYDLQLYDFNDDLVGSSHTVGDELINEAISSTGNYLIIVGSSQDDYSCTPYTLSLNWIPDSLPPPPPPPPPF